LFKHSAFYTAIFCLAMLIAGLARAEENKIDVQLTGVAELDNAVLLSGLSIVRQGNSARLSDKRVKQLDQSSVDELKNMLKVYGYYDAKVDSTLTGETDKWQATYHVTLGVQVHISDVQLQIEGEAQHDTAFQTLVSDFPLKINDGFTHDRYESAKKSILRLGASRGYFDSELLENSVEVNTDTNTARIILKWQSGIRYRFAKVEYPSTVINNDALARITSIKGGDYYSSKSVVTLRKELKESGYFESVAVTTLIDQRQDGSVPLSVVLDPDKKHKYTAAIGFGTDSGIRGGLGWENRYVNKKGHRIQAEAQLSEIKNSVGIDYNIPLGLANISEYGFNAAYKQETTDTSESTAQIIGGYYKTKRWGWDEKGSLRLLNENFDVGQDDDRSLLLIPGVTWSKTWADDSIYTRQGARLSLEVSGASDDIISDLSFVQTIVRGKYIQSISDKGRIITRSTVGMTEVNDFSRLPSSLRFFAGGDNSIRGFDYQALGPLDENDDVEGGRYLFVGSVEYEHMFYGDWGAAVFSDFGNAFNEWSDPFAYSVGAGLRWRSPIGMVRVDIASGISDDDNPIRLHIVIGPDL
jgi:translocation and assembly module TamA